MRDLGALVVGIGAYRYGAGTAFPPLQYSTTDADAFVGYLEACWPEASRTSIETVPQASATAEGIEAGFHRLQKAGPYDLQMIFLSGHGYTVDGKSGFLLQPGATSDIALLEPTHLDRMLAASSAKRTILILDCCFAEAIVGGMRFFDELGNQDARLFIASSRALQRTWEDDRVKHGIFTAHLLDLLRTGNAAGLAGQRDVLDVDSELFPVLCQQVPLYVLEYKRENQEPVKGGLACAAVTLPVVRAARRMKNRTALATAFIRMRQITAAVAAAGVALLAGAYLMLYYVEPDAKGNLKTRNGTRWLEPVFRFLPTTRVDTGVSVAELSPIPAAALPLQAGYTTGVWMHMAQGRYRRWFDTVVAGLRPEAAARYMVLAGVDGVTLKPVGTDSPSANTVEMAAWSALSNGDAASLDTLLPLIPGADMRSPAFSVFDPNDMNFEVLDLSVPDMESYAMAVGYMAAIDPDRALQVYPGFMKATQAWLFHNTDSQRGRDARDRVRNSVADVLGVIVRARADQSLPALDKATIGFCNQLAQAGYGEIVNAALGRIPNIDIGASAVVSLLSDFHGNVSDPKQHAAYETILLSLDGSQRAKRDADTVFERFESAGELQDSFLTRFLIVAAETKSLSAPLLQRLVAQARASLSKRERDFSDLENARLMAHAMGSVSPMDRPDIYGLIELVASDMPRASAIAEIYAALGRQNLDPPGMLDTVFATARLARAFDPSRQTPSRVAGSLILIGYDPWITALAIYGKTRRLTAEQIAVLKLHADNPSLRRVILPALMNNDDQSKPIEQVQNWADDLDRFSADAPGRALLSDTFANRAASFPRRQFLEALVILRHARQLSSEPEMRIALGNVIIESQYRRVGSDGSAGTLFN